MNCIFVNFSIIERDTSFSDILLIQFFWYYVVKRWPLVRQYDCWRKKDFMIVTWLTQIICEKYISKIYPGEIYIWSEDFWKSPLTKYFYEYISGFTVQNCTYVKGVYHRVKIYSRKKIFQPPPVTISIYYNKTKY